MKIYLVVWEDRHQDVQVDAFKEKKDALEHLDDIVSNYDIPDQEGMNDTEWIRYVRLSHEGDYVRVEETEMF